MLLSCAYNIAVPNSSIVLINPKAGGDETCQQEIRKQGKTEIRQLQKEGSKFCLQLLPLCFRTSDGCPRAPNNPAPYVVYRRSTLMALFSTQHTRPQNSYHKTAPSSLILDEVVRGFLLVIERYFLQGEEDGSAGRGDQNGCQCERSIEKSATFDPLAISKGPRTPQHLAGPLLLLLLLQTRPEDLSQAAAPPAAADDFVLFSIAWFPSPLLAIRPGHLSNSSPEPTPSSMTLKKLPGRCGLRTAADTPLFSADRTDGPSFFFAIDSVYFLPAEARDRETERQRDRAGRCNNVHEKSDEGATGTLAFSSPLLGIS